MMTTSSMKTLNAPKGHRVKFLCMLKELGLTHERIIYANLRNADNNGWAEFSV